MLMLTATTDSIAVVTSNGVAYDVDIVSTYIDRVTSTGAIGAAQRDLYNMTSATTQDVVQEPASDTTRKVKFINIRNAHATSAVDVLVELDANGVFYELHKATLLAGESLVYMEKIGWTKLCDTTRLERIKIVAGDQTLSSNAAFVDITDLTVPMKSGVMYGVLAWIIHNQSATTNGARFAYNIGNAPTDARFSNIDTVTASVTAAAFSAGTVTARDTAFTAQTTGALTTQVPCLIGGFIIPSADGTFALRVNEEENTASGLIVRAGSWMRVFRPTG